MARMNANRLESPENSRAFVPCLLTLVVWMLCLIVGVLGLLLPYPWPKPPMKEPPPVAAEEIKVEIASDATAAPNAVAPTASDEPAVPPPSPQAIAPPSPLTNVAVPTPAVAFAVPVDVAARVVEANHAAPASAAEVAAAVPPVQQLTYGTGEGRQPAPEYPREAIVAHQQGTVTVRFIVNKDGAVQTADVISPSPWPLLNQAAVRAVRDTWRFSPGTVRNYEVSIQFQLKER